MPSDPVSLLVWLLIILLVVVILIRLIREL